VEHTQDELQTILTKFLAISLGVLHNYFADPTKQVSDQ